MRKVNELFRAANSLAESLKDVDSLSLFRTVLELQGSSRSEGVEEESKSSSEGSSAFRRVGVWERNAESGQDFMRADRNEPSHFWSSREKIGPKERRQRIVLLGESVARGYFYDPSINAALILEAMLNSIKDDYCEVIDLARIDIDMKMLLSLARESELLDPDCIVCFAGNNWSPMHYVNSHDLNVISVEQCEVGLWKQLHDRAVCKHTEHIRRFICELKEIEERLCIPVIVAIPEFNLRDWRTEVTGPAMLDDYRLLEWFKNRDLAEQMLSTGDVSQAARHAERLVELDEGTSPVGYAILSRLAARNGDVSLEREMLKQMRDTGNIVTQNLKTPRCPRYVQETLRGECAAHEMSVVDLPVVFGEYLDGDIPDRRLFHDYCHLTFEGMRVAMAHIAQTIEHRVNRGSVEWQIFASTELKVSGQTVADAHLFAAIHNANRGNSYEVVKHHLEKALFYDQSLIDLLRVYVLSLARGIPIGLSSDFERFARRWDDELLSWLYRSPRLGTASDMDFVVMVREALAQYAPEIGAEIEEALREVSAKSPTSQDLLSGVHFPRKKYQAIHQEKHGYVQICERTTVFVLVLDSVVDVAIRVVARTPSGCAEAARCYVGGQQIGEIVLGKKWTTASIAIGKHLLSEGFNEITFVWPSEGWRDEARISRILASLTSGVIPEMRAIFAEIATLRASISRRKSPPPM